MRTSPLHTLAVYPSLVIHKIRNYFRPDPAWEKADEPPKTVARVKEADTAVADEPREDLWVDCSYCWVVACKNHWFHRRRNLFNVHRIPLVETDAVSTRPPIKQYFVAQCDECFKEHVYKPSDVLRWEMEPPSSFVPHPLFRDWIL